MLTSTASARADDVAYLVNVTVRPGYNFANVDAALACGRGICDRVDRGSTYADDVAAIKADFETDDYYQATYLISQAVNELCPELIWQLQKSPNTTLHNLASHCLPGHAQPGTEAASSIRAGALASGFVAGLEIIWVVGIPKARRRPPHVDLGANMLGGPFDRVLNDADAVAELRDMVRAVIGGQTVLQGLGHSDAGSRYEDHDATILHVGAPAETGGPNA